MIVGVDKQFKKKQLQWSKLRLGTWIIPLKAKLALEKSIKKGKL